MLKKFYQRIIHGNSQEASIPSRKRLRNRKDELFDVLESDTKDQDKINIHGLSNKEVNAILQQIFFSNTISDGSFLYSWNNHDVQGQQNGGAKFSAVARSRLYAESINQNEELLYSDDELDTVISQISKNKKVHIELGPESGEKFIKYASQWDPGYEYLKGKRYVGVDVSGVYVDMANKNVEKIGMKCESVPGDWFNHSIFDTEEGQIYYFFGGSICNLDVGLATDSEIYPTKKTMINLFRRMRSNKPFERVPIVITYFEAPEKDDPQYQDKIDRRKAAYGSKDNPEYFDEETHNAVSDFILSGFEALGLERSRLELAVEYDETHSPAMMKVGAKFLEKTEIQMGKYKMVKEAGDCVWAIKSLGLPNSMVKTIANAANFDLKYQKSRNGVGVAVLESKLGIHDKFKKARNIGYGILIAATLLGGGLLTQNIMHQKEIEKHQQKIDKDFASTQKILLYGNDHGYDQLTTDEEKIDFINTLADDILLNVSIRYHVHTDETDVRKMIKTYIKDKDILAKFSNTTNRRHNIFEVSDGFIQRYGDLLLEKDIDQMPYDYLKEFEPYFRDVILDTNMQNEKVVNINKSGGAISEYEPYVLDPTNDHDVYFNIQLQGIRGGTKTELVEEKIFKVENDNDAHRAKMYLRETKDIIDHHISDGYLYVKKWKERSPYNYVVVQSQQGEETKDVDPKLIAYDYFYQNRPIIHQIYERFGAVYRNMSGNHEWDTDNAYRWTKDSIKMLITRDLLQTGVLDKIGVGDNKAILKYLQGFVQRNAVVVQELGISKVPYDLYQTQYATACKNTMKMTENDVPHSISYTDRQKYKFNYINRYYSQEGHEYDVAEVEIAGSKYLYARDLERDANKEHTEEGVDIVRLDYYLIRGKEVVADDANRKSHLPANHVDEAVTK